jgi:HPr kinase/phosphorylase
MPTIHGSAVLLGAKAVLIRGRSGAGKSRLVLALIEAARNGLVPFARLIGDDRVNLEAHHGRLLARAAEPIAGLIENHGWGILPEIHENLGVIGLVVDLDAADAERMPEPDQLAISLEGVTLPRLPIAAGHDALAAILRFSPWLAGNKAVLAAAHQGRYRG